MSTQEILTAIKNLPLAEQRKILDELSHSVAAPKETPPTLSDEEFEQLLLARGIVSEIPEPLPDDEDDFEPIEVKGKPLSETIIEERR